MRTPLVLLLLAVTLPIAPATAATSSPSAAAAARIEGSVIEAMNAAGYTYFLVESARGKVWVAATEVAVKAGDRVVVGDATPMANYHSKTLNRTFELVYFTGQVAVNGKTPAPAPAASTASPRSAPAVDLKGIARAEGGSTVAEIHSNAGKLSGQKVTLRGRVVKYNGGIMGKNWLHVRDGSGSEGTNDLTVTTQAQVKVGDLVRITGVLATKRDFGGGYKYPVILEDATVVVE